MPNLIETLDRLVTPELAARLAAPLGELGPAAGKGMKAAFPVILAAVTGQTGDPGAMREIGDILTHPANDASLLREPAGIFPPKADTDGRGPLARRFVSLVFGERRGAVAASLAGYAGLKSTSGAAILELAAPLVVAALGEVVRKAPTGMAALAPLLASQRANIGGALPEVLAGVAAGPGWAASAAPLGQSAFGAAFAAIAGAALVALFASQLCRPSPVVEPGAASHPPAAAPSVGPARPAVSEPAPAPPGWSTAALPGGAQLTFPEEGIEAQLVGFIQDGQRAVDDRTWFDFDRLTFDSGAATLRPESGEQLRNVAAILKAFPAVRVKIGGYTDDAGDPQANQRLSGARAENVRAALVELGIAGDRLESEGYGEAHPVADNATADGRARNRRISLRVTRK